jgi:ADP-ribose pyrophosphatase
MAQQAPKPKAVPTVWPARWSLATGTMVVGALSALLFVPGAPALLGSALGGTANVVPLATGGAFVAVMLLVASFIGWRDPFVPPPLPSPNRAAPSSNPGKLSAEKILEEEFEYASTATEQAQEHRMTIVNFYLLIAGGAGSGVVALLTAKPEVAIAAGPLLWVITAVGGLFLLQLAALRRAWASSVMEMNYIKEFFIANSEEFGEEYDPNRNAMVSSLNRAFLWNPRSVPDTHKRGNVYYYSAILIALINTAMFLGGLFALGVSTAAVLTAPGSVVASALLGVLFFQGHMWLFDALLIPMPKNAPAAVVPPAAPMQNAPLRQPDPSPVTALRTSYTPASNAQPNVVTGSREIFRGKLLTVRVDDIRLPSGATSVREIVGHGPAVVIVAYLAESDEFLFIQQYRDAVGQVLLELPAGMVDPNEEPTTTAARELTEETGYVAGAVRSLGSYYTSPGFTDEQMHLFLATDVHQVSGIQDTDEIAALHRIGRAEAVRMVTQGRITDAKTIIGILWADRELPTHV